MKIAIDARIINTTTGRYVRKLLQYLQELDKDTTYYVLLTKKDFFTWNPLHPNFIKVEVDVAQYSVSEQITFLRILNKLKCDLVHFTMPQQPVLYRGKTVTTIHDLTLVRFKNYDGNKLLYDFKQLIFKQVCSYVAKKSKAVITPTNYVKLDVNNFIGGKQQHLYVIYDAADKITDSPAPIEHLANKKFIMYVGQMSPYKNIRRLIDAHQLLLHKHPSLHLVLAGKLDYHASELKEHVAARQLKSVHFTGFVSDAQLRWLYEHTAAYVFPSLSEGFGLPGLEAMQYGRPVVSSNTTCLPEVYKDAACFFDPTESKDMAKKIDEVLSDTELQQKLVNNGHKLLKHYSWKKMAQQTLAVYQETIGLK